MLVSLNGNISYYDIEKIKIFFSKGKGKTNITPNQMQTAIFKREHLSGVQQRDLDVSTQPIPDEVPDEYMRRDNYGKVETDKNGKNETWKHGLIAAIASQKSVDYFHYTSKVLSMGKEPKETLNLLAVFVILTLRNLMNYMENENQNNIIEMRQFSARHVKEPTEFSLTASIYCVLRRTARVTISRQVGNLDLDLMASAAWPSIKTGMLAFLSMFTSM